VREEDYRAIIIGIQLIFPVQPGMQRRADRQDRQGQDQSHAAGRDQAAHQLQEMFLAAHEESEKGSIIAALSRRGGKRQARFVPKRRAEFGRGQSRRRVGDNPPLLGNR